MIENFTSWIIEAIKNNGPISVFFGGIIEQIAGVLIPSPLIPMSAGFLLIPAQVNFSRLLLLTAQKISLPYALGGTLGASLLYFLVFYGGRTLIEKTGKFFGLSLKEIDRFRLRFSRGFKDEILIFLLVVLPVSSISLIAGACAIIGIPAQEFFPLLLAGTFFRSLFLAILGWKIGETYQEILHGLEKTETIFSLLFLGVIFCVLAALYYRRKKFFNSGE
jgi:membrane protein DedA with SNARE-associated domain